MLTELSNINQIKTPCIGICSTGIGDQVCRGCKRFSHEVIHWNSYNTQQKQWVWQRLDQLTQQVMSEIFIIDDPAQLQSTLAVSGTSYASHCSVYTWAFQLLRAAHKSMQSSDQLTAFGLSIYSSYIDYSPSELYQLANEKLIDLSTAYFEATAARQYASTPEPA